MVDPTGPRNPWGSPPPQNNNQPPRGPIPPRPDLNDMFGKAQNSLRDLMPGGGIAAPLLLIGAIWLGSGLYLVAPGEDAVIQRFGAWNRTQTEPGIGAHFPWPVEARTIVNTDLDRRLTIGFEDGNRRGSQNLPSESQMLTEDANIVDINVVILWNVSRAEDYLFNVAEPDFTIKQVAESALREAVGQAPLQQIITEGRDDVATSIQQTMQAILDNYKAGISIKQVLIQEATVHPDVLEAFDDVVAARQDGERFQNEATIYRNDVIPAARGEATKMVQEAEAYKEAQVAKAKGDAERFNEIYAAYVSGKDVTRERIYIETMESVLRNARTVVLDGKASQGAVPVLPLPGAAQLPAPPAAPQGVRQ